MAENQQLRIARKRKHWSQTQAARACGVDLQTYFRWEHGEQEPRGYNLDRLCEVFGLPMEALGYTHLVEAQIEEGEAAQPGDQSGLLMRLTPEQMAALLPLIQPGDSTVDAKKRETLRKLLTTTTGVVAAPFLLNPEPWERLATAKPTAINQETIQHFNGLLNTCRELSNGNELPIAESVLSSFLPRLQATAPYQSEVASLAAQGLQLRSILSAHRLNLQEKVTLCEQAVEYARHAADSTTLVTSLLELAVAFQYLDQPTKALQSYQEALLYSNRVSPVLRARIYVETGAALAKSGRKQEAQFYLGMAYDTLPDHPERDPSFALSDFCSQGTLSLYNGLIHLAIGTPSDAWNGFEKFKSDPSSSLVPERIRLEIINHQGKAALLANDLDQYANCLKDGVGGALALGSKKRYNEALTIFQQDVPDPWRKEPQLRAVIEQFALPSEG